MAPSKVTWSGTDEGNQCDTTQTNHGIVVLVLSPGYDLPQSCLLWGRRRKSKDALNKQEVRVLVPE